MLPITTAAHDRGTDRAAAAMLASPCALAPELALAIGP